MDCPGVAQAARRLKLISGFATVYGVRQEPRLDVFARIWHVQRVVRFAEALAVRFDVADRRSVCILGWLHDLNRWPFAHNSELNFFSQAANSLTYFKGMSISAGRIDEIIAIQEKELARLGPEGKCVLLADVIVGMLEDPLLLVTAMRVRPEFLPDSLSRRIGFSLSDPPWRRRLLELARLATPTMSEVDAVTFRHLFDDVVMDQAKLLIRERADGGRAGLGAARILLELTQEVKADCHRPFIFPINNELACHASWLRDSVIPWYQSVRPIEDLVFIDEYEMVSRVVETANSPFEARDFVPDIDVIYRDSPDLRFVE